MSLDEKLESVSKGIKSINDSLDPYLQATPTIPHNGSEAEANETAAIIRKHNTLVSEWEAVQDESEVLREELKEDKWLTVFRTVTDQADGMMSSLEKGVNRCQVRSFVYDCGEDANVVADRNLYGKFTGEVSKIRWVTRRFRLHGPKKLYQHLKHSLRCWILSKQRRSIISCYLSCRPSHI